MPDGPLAHFQLDVPGLSAHATALRRGQVGNADSRGTDSTELVNPAWRAELDNYADARRTSIRRYSRTAVADLAIWCRAERMIGMPLRTWPIGLSVGKDL